MGHGHGNPELPHYCQIRSQAIDDPGYTYCLNHPYRSRAGDPIPIGPILVAEVGSGLSFERVPWQPSPDTEEVRLHLLELLGRAEDIFSEDYHPAFGPKIRNHPDYAGVVIWQLGQFREQRAVPGIEFVRGKIPDLAAIARQALEAISD